MHARLLLPLLAALALGACASVRPSMSYVAPEVTALDAQALAGDVVAYLADPLPPAHTTLLLDPPTNGPDALTAAMTEKLRARGYGVTVVDASGATRPGTALRYLASPLDNGLVLRLQYGGHEAAKLYPRTTTGQLLTNGPFTLREAGQ